MELARYGDMTGSSRTRIAGLTTPALALALLAAPAARAQDRTWSAIAAPPRPFEPNGAARPRLPMLAPPSALHPQATASLGAQQLQAFASLVDDSEQEVQARLFARPGLAPLALAASTARLERERLGKSMTTGGFVLLGASVTASLLIVAAADFHHDFSWSCDSACESQYRSERKAGIAVGLVGAALGLAIAIPGIVKLSRRTPAEAQAVRAYLGTE